MRQEITATQKSPVPKSYGFLPKGDRYKTFHCRKLTHEAGCPLYIVVDDNKRATGIRVPLNVLKRVHNQAKETITIRRAATAKRDAIDIAKAAAEMDVQFPKMPTSGQKAILKHGFQKHSGRVGRTSSMPLSQKVFLAVIAHVRHTHTDYDALLKRGRNRNAARKSTRKNIEIAMLKWGYTQGAKRNC
jgi:hypothetical protein